MNCFKDIFVKVGLGEFDGKSSKIRMGNNEIFMTIGKNRFFLLLLLNELSISEMGHMLMPKKIIIKQCKLKPQFSNNQMKFKTKSSLHKLDIRLTYQMSHSIKEKEIRYMHI